MQLLSWGRKAPRSLSCAVPKKEEGQEGAEQILEVGKRNLGRSLSVLGGQGCYLTHHGVMLQEAVLGLLWGWWDGAVQPQLSSPVPHR